MDRLAILRMGRATKIGLRLVHNNAMNLSAAPLRFAAAGYRNRWAPESQSMNCVETRR